MTVSPVQLTPIRSFSRLTAWEVSRERIEVRGTEDCDFSYFVNGVRRGFERHQAVRKNSDFVPTLAGVPFGSEYLKAFRDLLVENGTLNPDYTPNVETALRLGWILKQPTAQQVEDANRWEEASKTELKGLAHGHR